MARRRVFKQISQASKTAKKQGIGKAFKNIAEASKPYIKKADDALLSLGVIKKVDPQRYMGVSRIITGPVVAASIGFGVTAGAIVANRSALKAEMEENDPYVHPGQYAPAYQRIYGAPQPMGGYRPPAPNMGATGDLTLALHNLRHG